MDEQIKKLEAALAKLKNNDSKIYFLTQDTEGRAAASVITNYQYVKNLLDAGFNYCRTYTFYIFFLRFCSDTRIIWTCSGTNSSNAMS